MDVNVVEKNTQIMVSLHQEQFHLIFDLVCLKAKHRLIYLYRRSKHF